MRRRVAVGTVAVAALLGGARAVEAHDTPNGATHENPAGHDELRKAQGTPNGARHDRQTAGGVVGAPF